MSIQNLFNIDEAIQKRRSKILARQLIGIRGTNGRMLDNFDLVHLCYYCGEGIFIPNDRHLDHVYPKSRGGANENWNLVSACSACNQAKNAKSPIDWLDMMRDFLPEAVGIDFYARISLQMSYLVEKLKNSLVAELSLISYPKDPKVYQLPIGARVRLAHNTVVYIPQECPKCRELMVVEQEIVAHDRAIRFFLYCPDCRYHHEKKQNR